MRRFPVTVSLDPSVYIEADKKAKEEKRSLSSVINNIVIEYFERENNDK